MPTTTMSPDKALVEEVHTFLQAEHLNALGTALDEDPGTIARTFAEVLPLVVSALAGRARQPNGPEVIRTLTQQAHQHAALQQLSTAGRQPWHGRGVTLMQGLLGDAYAGSATAIAARHGLSAAEFEHLLDVAVAAVLGTLGKHAAEHQLTADALSAWLQRQPAGPRLPTQPHAMAAVAEPIDRPVVGPTPSPAPAAQGQPAAASQLPPAPADGTWGSVGGGITFTPTLTGVRRRKRPKWQWALLLLPALGLGFGFGYRSKLVPAPVPAAVPAPVAAPEASAPRPVPTASSYPPSYPAGYYDVLTDTYIRETGPQLLLTLADGNTLSVGTNSTEYQLYRFLSDPRRQPNTVSPALGWINLDRVYFEPNRATLTDDSRAQLRNVAKILKVFPEAHLQLGGYTDGTGNPSANLRLSQQRASEARRTLVQLGVEPQRLRAEGFGANYFIASNAGAVGRALNRRLSVRVISKTGAAGLPPNMQPPAAKLPASASNTANRNLGAAAEQRPSSAEQRRKRKRTAAQPRTKAGLWLQNLGQCLQGKRVAEWEKKR
ncbi:OmpA family protein [Hymenobacter oligotrophus]|uniref:OmpA family protein n=1 Tax=Hymenobacter oligotrophus TaxID=2319843 RepID=A0A3B7R0K4_9BACT|nr:OmpA family protein [Hymenobacter oligotrophus]AYA37594.1 OmpA family protein [Hymenobacter oligotrophus]